MRSGCDDKEETYELQQTIRDLYEEKMLLNHGG